MRMTAAGEVEMLYGVQANPHGTLAVRAHEPKAEPHHAPHAIHAFERIGMDEARGLLDRGRFFTEYEPLVSLASGRTVAFEALARFRRFDGRLAAPDRVLAA